MTDLRKAAEMALDYIKDIRDHCACEGIECEKEDGLIEALRQALAQPEQDEGVDGSVHIYIKRNGTFERVDTVEKALELSREMHTAPFKREWVGLTDEEAGILFKDTDWVNDDWGHLSYARAIEAKLKEKNT